MEVIGFVLVADACCNECAQFSIKSGQAPWRSAQPNQHSSNQQCHSRDSGGHSGDGMTWDDHDFMMGAFECAFGDSLLTGSRSTSSRVSDFHQNFQKRQAWDVQTQLACTELEKERREASKKQVIAAISDALELAESRGLLICSDCRGHNARLLKDIETIRIIERDFTIDCILRTRVQCTVDNCKALGRVNPIVADYSPASPVRQVCFALTVCL
jgi:hypothetical protein